jgi:hypothetical protein
MAYRKPGNTWTRLWYPGAERVPGAAGLLQPKGLAVDEV